MPFIFQLPTIYLRTLMSFYADVRIPVAMPVFCRRGQVYRLIADALPPKAARKMALSRIYRDIVSS